MNTQKIQTRGFTLVELIVVITILVILGTIAFINLGGQSAAARDSKRTSDIRNLVSQVNIKQTAGVGFVDMVTANTTYQLTNLNLGGSGTNVAVGTTYNAGNPNTAVLGVSADTFKDPDTKLPYVMGATSLVGGAYQIAATLENDASGNAGKNALVMGTFKGRLNTETYSGASTASVNGLATIALATGKGFFDKDDYIVGAGANAGRITAISGDLGTITVNGTWTAVSNPALKLTVSESAGLIAATKRADNGTVTANTAVVSGSGNTLPY